jgi:hypothetical protein
MSFVTGAAAAMVGGYLSNGGRVLAQPTGDHIVQAPFVVTDAQGRAIFDVRENGPLRRARLLNTDGYPVIELSPTTSGGVVEAHSVDDQKSVGLSAGELSGFAVYKASKLLAELSAVDAGGALTVADTNGTKILYASPVVEAGSARVTIGQGGASTMGLRVFNASNTLLAAVGEATSGAGGIVAFDSTGKPRAVMHGKNGDLSALDTSGRVVAVVSSENNRGVVAVNGAATVGKLTVESGGGGLIELADPAGNRQVVLGVTAGSEGRACVTDPAKGTTCLGKTAPGTGR